MNIATIEEAELDTDMEKDVGTEDRVNYGSDEERCRAYIRAMEVVLERLNYWASGFDMQEELQLVLAYIQRICP